MTTKITTTSTYSTPLLWWTYNQNNSGGSFYGPQYVFVQARNAAEADFLAEQSNLVYFDSSGDCDCCGARWYSAVDYGYSEDGTIEPTLYGEVVDWEDPKGVSGMLWEGQQSARVLFDGAIEYGATYAYRNGSIRKVDEIEES